MRHSSIFVSVETKPRLNKGESMSKVTKHFLAAVAIVGLAVSGTQAIAADRTADEILKELDGNPLPTLDRAKINNAQYRNDYVAAMQKALPKRLELIQELHKAAPDHEKLTTLLPERWLNLPRTGVTLDAMCKEVEEAIAHTKNDKLKIEGSFIKAQVKLALVQQGGKLDLTPVDEFIKLAPKDERCSQLLFGAINFTKDEKAKAALEDRLIKEYPASMFAGMLAGSRRQREAVGKPFDLEFTDAIKGTTVSIKGLKGKVVVVDFWATWCGPCVAEMPKMKKIYAEYHEKGVEFIGVSLDQSKEQGGLDKLKKFVAEKEIPWPQYYQGNGWDSEFSKSWGINGIPCMFIVDQEGKLVTVEGREQIEKLIPELLKKKEAPSGAGAGAGGK